MYLPSEKLIFKRFPGLPRDDDEIIIRTVPSNITVPMEHDKFDKYML
jgi:hypothetical protein